MYEPELADFVVGDVVQHQDSGRYGTVISLVGVYLKVQIDNDEDYTHYWNPSSVRIVTRTTKVVS